MSAKTDHADCPNVILRHMADLGCEITVSLARPLVVGTYTTDGFTCPHGTTYWIEPTGEQIAAWARDGVR